MQMLLPSVVEAGPVVPPLVPWSCDGEPMVWLSVRVPRRCVSGVLVVGWGMLGLVLLGLEFQYQHGVGMLVLCVLAASWGCC